MKKAKFYKVSFEQFQGGMSKFDLSEDKVKEIYDNIKLPKRATICSAGYDFFTPIDITLKPNETINLPTGIRCEMNESWVLMLFPRSGLGFKYRLQLNNTVGIIDSDYFNADNEGHIFIKLTNDTNEDKTVNVNAGEGIAQGIFMVYGTVEDDEVSEKRTGGFGSTSREVK